MKDCSIDDTYLTGIRIINGIKIISLNSAWFSQRKIVAKEYDDSNMLWLGLPILEHLESKGLFNDVERDTSIQLTIVIFHHPFEELNQDERIKRDPRKSTKEYISFRSHMVLTGHEHSLPSDPDLLHGRSHLLRGGATYDTHKYINSFNLIQLNDESYNRRAYVFNSSESDKTWRCVLERNYEYWDQKSKYLKKVKKEKVKNEINDNITSLEALMTNRDFVNGLNILIKGTDLLKVATTIMNKNEIDIYRVRYSKAIMIVISSDIEKDLKDSYTKYIQQIY